MHAILADHGITDVADFFKRHGGILEGRIVQDAVIVYGITFRKSGSVFHTGIRAVFLDQVFEGGTAV